MNTSVNSEIGTTNSFTVTDGIDKSNGFFSADEVIDAYFKGKSDQVNAHHQVLLDKFKENMQKTEKVAKQIAAKLKASNLKCLSIHLKAKDIYSFYLLVLVDEASYLTEKFDDIYKFSLELRRNVNNSSTYNLAIMFAGVEKELNMNKIISDGYFYTFSETIA